MYSYKQPLFRLPLAKVPTSFLFFVVVCLMSLLPRLTMATCNGAKPRLLRAFISAPNESSRSTSRKFPGKRKEKNKKKSKGQPNHLQGAFDDARVMVTIRVAMGN